MGLRAQTEHCCHLDGAHENLCSRTQLRAASPRLRSRGGLRRGWREEREGKEAGHCSTCSASAKLWLWAAYVREPTGPLSLSRTGSLGRGRKGVQERPCSREADCLEDDCPLSPLGGRSLELSLFFSFFCVHAKSETGKKRGCCKEKRHSKAFLSSMI